MNKKQALERLNEVWVYIKKGHYCGVPLKVFTDDEIIKILITIEMKRGVW